MALIVEDGSGVANADSYADVAFIRAYCSKRGFALPADDADVEVLAINAMDAIEARKYAGVRSYLGQPLSFPRVGVETDEGEYRGDVIPPALKQAEAQLVAYQAAGVVLFPSGNVEAAIKRDKTGPLETEYFEADGFTPPSIPLADALLSSLERGQGEFSLRTVRA